MDITNLFGLSASEAKTQNDWTKEYLPGWNETFEPEKSRINLSHRELIILEPRLKDYLEPANLEVNLNNEVNTNDEVHANVEADLWVNKSFKLFGSYSSNLPREINYYEHYYIAMEEFKQIVRIHERMHAFQHVNSDGVWDNFGITSPVYLEFLAQVFTYKCVQGTYLEPYFRRLSKEQPYIYSTWQAAEALKNDEVITLYNEIKNMGTSSFSDLDDLAKIYDQRLAGQLLAQPGIERLTKEHDEIYKKNDDFQHRKIDIELSNAMDDLWA